MASRPYADINFAEYAPDWGGLPRSENPGYLTDAVNIRLTPNGWRGVPSFADVSSAAVIGAVSTNTARAVLANHWETLSGSKLFVNTPQHFVVIAGSIFVSQTGTSWTDVTPAGTAVTTDGDWLQFENLLIYVCAKRAPISKDIYTVAYNPATVFAALSGSPPTAAHGARVREHVVLGQLTNTDPYGVQWSAIGDATNWPTPGTASALAVEAGTQTLGASYGRIEAVRGSEKFGLVYQSSAVTRMTYVGGSAVYEFDTFDKRIGAGSGSYGAPVSDGNLWYWYNKSGMFVTDGYSVNKISLGKADAALFANLISHPLASSVEATIHGAYFPTYDRIMWGVGSYTGTQYQLSYHPKAGTIGIDSGTTLMAMYEAQASLDNPTVYNISGTTRKLQQWNGASGSIALQTGYIEIDPGYTVQFQGAHLLGTGTSGLTLAYKTATSSSACDVSQSGFTSLTTAGRGQKQIGRPGNVQYIAFRVTGTGAESQLIRGVRIYFERAEPAS